MQLADRRTTKYVTEVKKVIHQRGHASNADIVNDLRVKYPNLSTTTIHRVTQRLYEDEEIRKGPNTLGGSVRYDANLDRHDHFMCTMCGEVRDIVIPKTCMSIIKCNIEDCSISGPLTVSGVCKHCKTKWEEDR